MTIRNSSAALYTMVITTMLFCAGCMTERLPPPAAHPGIPQQDVYLVKKVGYDEHGRPVFGDRLAFRPVSAGSTFTVVHSINGLPSRSYDIALEDQPKTDPGPLAVIYTWTDKGFEGGVEITSGIAPQGTISSGPEAAAYLAIKAAPIVVLTATGFVVGVLASIPETAKELGRVVVSKREVLTGYRTYAYDERNRIRFMKLYAPEEHTEPLVTTEYFYEGAGNVPVRAVATSLAEKKVRNIPAAP